MSSRCSLLLVLASLPAALVAQSYAPRSPAPAPIVALNPNVVDPADVARAFARADSAEETGRTADARRIYKKLIADLESDGQFAGAALWRLALTYFYADDKWQAAQLFDRTASAANQYGDPALELRATFEGAALWQQLKRPDLAATRLERVTSLLQSPAISEAEKEAVRKRMA